MSESRLGAPPDDDDAQTQTRDAFGVSGGTIGPYRLLETLGEGGMGEVWLAEQTEPVRRQVAVKIIKAGMDTSQVVARFEAERQALALMDHSAIAKVFDAGATAQGRPYFAMEYVRGESLTSFCDRLRLTIRDRLELFIHVCEGVQHAHQKGIIHRDLKPSNILVTLQDDRPVPKIIDFGVAKAVSQPLTQHTLYTSLTGFVGTPEYMSPEQAEMGGVDIDTRTDVYGLGVMLYELLTGALPFEGEGLKEKSLDEIRRTIRDVDPPRPSTKVTRLGTASIDAAKTRHTEPSRLASVLRGDLDWITMRALEKNRTRRYGSASDFAADLRRHLEHQPVTASPPRTVYRIRKFVRRHRAGVAASTLVFVFVTMLAGIMAWQARRVARERDRANFEAATATQVSEFLASLFRVSDPGEARGNSLTARQVLDNGARRIEKELTGQPEIQGRLMALIGDVYSNLGLFAQAESVLARSLEIRSRALGLESPDTAASANKLAAVFGRQGKLSQAEPLIRQSLDVRRRVLGPEHPDTLVSLSNLANILLTQGHVEQAEVYARNVLDIRRRTLGDDAPETLDSLNNLGALVSGWNKVEAESYVREAVTRSRRVQGQDHPRTLAFLRHLADLLSRSGNYHEAELVLREVLDVQRRVLGTDHLDLLITRTRLGGVLRLERKLNDAEAEFQEILERQQHLGVAGLGETLEEFAKVRLDQSQYEEAEKLGRRILAIAEEPDLKFRAMTLVGRALLSQDRFEAAEPFLVDSYSEHVRAKLRSEELDTQKLIVELYERWNRPDTAAEWRAKLPK